VPADFAALVYRQRIDNKNSLRHLQPLNPARQNLSSSFSLTSASATTQAATSSCAMPIPARTQRLAARLESLQVRFDLRRIHFLARNVDHI